MKYFDGFGKEVTSMVVGLQTEVKRLRMDVELLEGEVKRLKKFAKRRRKVKKQVADAS